MSRYTDPDCKLCRRETMKLFLKGTKCESPKCPVEKRPFPPGQHGRARPREKEYQVRLREKQKARRIYGVQEKQFRRYYDLAARQKGPTGENLLRLLELRLDNVVYRSGFAQSRDDARQLVLHRHVHVNGRIVNVPSFRVREQDVVSVKPAARQSTRVQVSIERALSKTIPGWLNVSYDNFNSTVVGLPQRSDIDSPVKESFIVEFYSR